MSWKIKTLEELFEKGSSKLTLKAVKDCVGPFKVFGANGLCGHSDQYDQEQQYFAVIKDGAGVGRISFHEPQSSVLGTMQYLIPRGHENFRFLHYALLNLKLSSFAVGSTIPHIYFKDYKGLNVGVPTLEEQERIVEILDEAFAAIDKAKANIERNLTNARELFQSRLNDIFSNPSEGWEVKPLGEVCERITKGSTPTSYGHSFQQEGVNFVKVESLTEDGRFLPSKFAFVSEACHTEFKRSQLREGDILISIAGTLGRTAIVSEHILPANTNQALAIVRLEQGVPIHTVKREFVVRFIQNSTEHIASIRSGTAQPNLSLTQLKNFLIPIPPLGEQERIVTELDSLDELKRSLETKYQSELDNLEELRQSILEQAFEGKLTEPVAA